MSAAEITQMFIILAPLVKDAIVEGGKIVATFREDITQEQLIRSLELSRSTTWPELSFKP